MKIVFMGTPDFAVASLNALLEAGFDLVGVITAPDKPAGRGQKINESAVKQFAVEKGLKILQPVKLKDPEFIQELRSLNADLQVVVAFRMLPEIVWNMPVKGTINLHGSLLPQYRGAAPINWAIINGEKESGVSTFFLKQEIDTGDILFAEKVNIEGKDTAADLHDKLMIVGAKLLVKTVKAIELNDYKEIPQDINKGETLKSAPKIFREDCQINWNQPAMTIYNHIRGLSPYPAAFCLFQEKTLKIFQVEVNYSKHTLETGSFQTDHKTTLQFACADGFISVLELQLEGKKKMKIDEFLRGIRLQ
ncbi:methionyl-tRNA formyltransferase [Daejeonella sp.]|uniref:methionyl-tRNA formyltransferase n=1 Tax=Daejeonella sp. TaxID=2805397 RepID=UPI0027BA8980|nr:methionyl-tRNA formyltransferase [Daejeonella sp.]